MDLIPYSAIKDHIQQDVFVGLVTFEIEQLIKRGWGQLTEDRENRGARYGHHELLFIMCLSAVRNPRVSIDSPNLRIANFT